MFGSLKVLEIGDGLAGSIAASHFAQFGATTYKAEDTEGDWTRQVPPLAGESSSALFAALNRGKREIVVSFGESDQVSELLAFAGKMDVVILDRTTQGDLSLRNRLIAAKSPKTIMCSISAFGDHGPWAERTGSEFVAQAASGYWRYITGPDEEPLRVGAYIASVATAVFAAQGIMAALWKRAEDKGSRGDVVEVNLLQSLLAMKTHHIAAQYGPDRWEGTRATGATDKPQFGWKAGDGKHLVFSFGFGTGRSEGWREFCREIGMTDEVIDRHLAEGALQTTGIGRAANELRSLYEDYFGKFTAAEIVALTRKHGGTAALYDDYAGMVAGHIEKRHLFGPATLGQESLKAIGIPWLIDGTPVTGGTAVPGRDGPTAREAAKELSKG